MTPEKLTKGQKSSGNENLKESIDNNKRSKNLRERPSTSGKQIQLKRSERVKAFYDAESLESGDSIVYPSTAPETRRSVDVVVVDVHNEIKGSEPSLATRKLFKQRNSSEDKKLENKFSGEENQRRNRRREIDYGNAWEIQESVDSIKEFEEGEIEEPEKRRIENDSNYAEIRNVEENLGDSNASQSYPQLHGSAEKILPNLRENLEPEEDPGDSKFKQEPKRRRKRWTKNENNLQLTQELIVNSSDTNQSAENDSKCLNLERIRPVPAPRRKKGVSRKFSRESNLAFDNGAYRSDTEEVLRIETEVYEPQGASDGSQNCRKSTKIQMTKFYDTYEKVSDNENEEFDPADDFTGSLSVRDNKRLHKIETIEASSVADSSDEVQTEVNGRERTTDSQSSFNRSKSRGRSAVESVSETSELSEDQESEDRVLGSDGSSERFKNEKMKRINRKSVDLDTGNSLTDISDLPRSKSCREIRHKSKSKRRGDSKNRRNEGKRRTKHREKKRESENNEIEYNSDKEEEKFTSITIHKSDVLKTDFTTKHPMVKIHIVDMKTGNYLKTRSKDDDKKCSYLQPLITGKFDFKAKRSIVPNWEEELIFEYNFNEIILQLENQRTLILFEILDLLNFAEASFNYSISGNEACWHKIAWAFLRPVGVNGTLHVNKKLRLQLYEPFKTSKKSGRVAKCEVFNWWRSTNKAKYPSTLYVTLKSVDPPIEEPILYERLSLNDLMEMENESHGSFRKSSDLLELPKWSRLAAQSCKIPNNHLFDTETFENGSYHLTFSNNGKYLACVGSDDGNYPIFVYSIPEGKILAQFSGHSNFIYSLNWSKDDKYLLSVSSDQTARIWNMGKKIIQHIQMLPHPSYVYCGKFYPGLKNVVVTGCYDCVARIWTKCKSTKSYELTQELYEHKGYVNSLCFQKDGGLITADSIGVVIVWALKKRGRASAPREWRLLKIIRNKEIENVVINTIALHPLGSRLLVHSRDNGLRIIDLETGVVLQRYKGLRNRRLQITACLSPCGGLVFCGGEDSYLTVWNLENGKRLGRYLIREAKIVACVDYHPFDHILAFSTFGNVSAIRILNFEKNSTGENVGLSLLIDNDAIEDSDDFEITVKFDKNDLFENSKVNCSGRRSTNVSKRGERLDGEINRSYKTNRKPSTEVNEDTKNKNSISRREFLRFKIQRLNETQEGLKSRSAARLNNIIEKIDRILVNTTSKKDLSSTCSSTDMRRQDFAKVLSNSRPDSVKKSQYRMESRSSRSRSEDKSSTLNTDGTAEAFTASEEFIEMANISSVHNETSENDESTISNRKLLRLKTRAEMKSNISSRNDDLLEPEEEEEEEEEEEDKHFVYKSSSESHRKTSSSKGNQFHDGSNIDTDSNGDGKTKKRIKRRGNGRSGFSDDKIEGVSHTETCVIDLENVKSGFQSNPSTSDSAGTYTIDKEKFSKPWEFDEERTTDTNSSVKSSATFTIENEICSARKSASRKE